MRAVHDRWQQHCDNESVWDSPENRASWLAATGEALAVLRREVADFADVVDERDDETEHWTRKLRSRGN